MRLRRLMLVAIAGMMAGGSSAGGQQIALAGSSRTYSSAEPLANHSQKADMVLATPVTMSLENVTLDVALREIIRVSGVRIAYTPAVVPIEQRVSLSADKRELGDVLRQLLRHTGAVVHVSPAGRVMIVAKTSAEKERAQGTIIGKVIDAKTKRPVAGATVMLDQANNGIVTASDGTFRLPAGAGERVVHVRALGFVRKSMNVTVTGEQSVTLDVALEPSASVLDEVIVTGTVVATERRAIPNPITVITADDIEKRGITNVEQFLRGEVPGVIALETGSYRFEGGRPGSDEGMARMETANVYTRGASAFPPGSQGEMTPNPLKTFIDGVELLNAAYLGTIDPQSIERIEIIAGPQAATIYGSGAMGGVMQIFTKRGGGKVPEVMLSARYGMLQSNLSDGRTPTHDHALNVTGGTGPGFSYASSVSYNYAGQWVPGLFKRRYGFSIGSTYGDERLKVSGSVAMTGGKNGTSNGSGHASSHYVRALQQAGIWSRSYSNEASYTVRRVSTSSSQILSLNVDYRPVSIWQHHLTLGRSQNDFALTPRQAGYETTRDTLLGAGSSTGRRMTAGYNTTITPHHLGPLSTTLTLGSNGSWGRQTQLSGCFASKSATSMISCFTSSPMRVNTVMDVESWGVFGTGRIGVFDRLYLTLGLRGERNPVYGDEHTIDWTPTNGLTYTFEFRNVAIKLLASYGRATRPPVASMKDAVIYQISGYDIPEYVDQVANVNLRPEVSRGPQGGIEIYVGNRGSLTINHYQQNTEDLIAPVYSVDSTKALRFSDGESVWLYASQYRNIERIRQQGWESTAGVNLGPLTMKGTYSWADSRVLKSTKSWVEVGWTGYTVPTHTGNFIVSYANGGTSVTMTTNYVGSSNQYYTLSLWWQNVQNSRLPVYSDTRKQVDSQWSKPGYVKSDLAATHRISPAVSLVMNVINLGNSYGSEVTDLMPALGRQTSVGISWRLRGRR